jgi:predicted MFS family arabinose efflux permease
VARSKTFDPSAALSIAAYVLTAGVANLKVAIGPLLVGAYVESLGFTAQQAGYLYSAETAGDAVGGAIIFALVSRLNWRLLVLIGFLAVIGGNLAATAISGYLPMMATRFCTGIGEGILIAMTFVSIGLTRDPDRIYGLWTLSLLVTGAAGTALAAELIPDYGLKAPFIMIATSAVAIVWMCRHFPTGSEPKAVSTPLANTRQGALLAMIALTGSFFFYAGQSAVWPFVERMGTSSELAYASIGRAISFSNLATVAVVLGAIALGNVLGRVVPLFLTVLASAASMVILGSDLDITAFTIGVCLLNSAWYFCVPYLLAVIANLDSNGKYLAIASVVFPASISAGPLAASALLKNPGDYSPVVWIGLSALVAGFVLLYPAARARGAAVVTVSAK